MINKSLGKNAALNLIRVVFSLLFPLVTFPYISRTIGPDGYGKVNYCISIVSYFTLFATFGITDYAAREGARVRDNQNKLQILCNQIFSINLLITVITFIFYLIFIDNIPALKNYKMLLIIEGIQLIFIPFSIEWFYTICEDFRYITIRSIIVQFISLILLLCFVKSYEDYYKYALILVLSSSGAGLFNFIHSRKILKIKVTKNIELKKHLKPMIILLGHSIALTIYVSSDTTMLGYFCNDYTVGIYSAASKIYLIVKQLLNAITIVAVPRLSNYLGNHDEYNYRILSNKLIKYLFAFSCPCVVGIACLSKQIMVLIGGNQYTEAGTPLLILAFALFFAVFACLLTQGVLLPRKLEKYILLGSVSSAIVNFSLNFIAIPFWGYNGAAFTTVIAEAMMFLISLYYSRKYLRIEIGKDVMSVLIGSCIIFVICILLNKLIDDIYLYVVVSILVSSITYIFILIKFKHTILDDFFLYLKSK